MANSMPAIVFYHLISKRLKMKDRDFAIAYLNAVEKKHKAYFTSANLRIANCVEIIGNDLVTVQVVNDDLPAAVRYDIEVMFWRS